MAKLGFDPDGLALKAQRLASQLISVRDHYTLLSFLLSILCLQCRGPAYMVGLSELSLNEHTAYLGWPEAPHLLWLGFSWDKVGTGEKGLSA